MINKNNKLNIFFDKIEKENFNLNFNHIVYFAKKRFKKNSLPESINVVFTDNMRIQELNREFRKKDKPTDVLSFNYSTFQEDDILAKLEDDKLKEITNVGEIYISIAYIKEGCKRKDLNFNLVLLKTIIHGLVHLAGFDHKTNLEAKKMEKIEKKILDDTLLTKRVKI